MWVYQFVPAIIMSLTEKSKLLDETLDDDVRTFDEDIEVVIPKTEVCGCSHFFSHLFVTDLCVPLLSRNSMVYTSTAIKLICFELIFNLDLSPLPLSCSHFVCAQSTYFFLNFRSFPFTSCHNPHHIFFFGPFARQLRTPTNSIS